MKILTSKQKRLLDGEFKGLQEKINEGETTIRQFRDELKRYHSQTVENELILKERIAELEFAMEDRDWIQLSMESDREFSREGIDTINKLARLFFLKNPLIRRAVLTQTQYVFGQGVNISASDEDVNAVVQNFLDDPKNRAEFTDHQSRMVKETELQIEANIFFVFFVNQWTGQVKVRTIPVDEIREIICDPEDGKTPLYYKRVYKQKRYNLAGREIDPAMKTVFYPDWKNVEGQSVVQFTNKVEDAYVYHVSVNKLSDMKFGVSEIYAACDWAKAYKEFLEDWTTIVKAYSRFAWKLNTKGGKKGVQAAKDKVKTSLGVGTGGVENNPSPATGSFWLGTEGTSLDPIKTAGATTKAEDGDKLIHMICAATGIFYHYLVGDPSTGNLATAKAMERPMEMMFRDRQQLWISIYQEILNFVVEQSVKAPLGKLNSMGTIARNDFGEEVIELDGEREKTIEVSFPDLLEKDTEARIKAIISAATLDGKSRAGTLEMTMIVKMLLEALGIDGIDEIVKRMYPTEPDLTDNEKEMVQVAEEINESVRKLIESVNKHNGTLLKE